MWLYSAYFWEIFHAVPGSDPTERFLLYSGLLLLLKYSLTQQMCVSIMPQIQMGLPVALFFFSIVVSLEKAKLFSDYINVEFRCHMWIWDGDIQAKHSPSIEKA